MSEGSNTERSECGSGRAGYFATTHWSVVIGATHGSSGAASEALEQLCGTYWYPLYAFVRRQGTGHADAQDLVQGFFERFLEKTYLADVSRENGKFRSFLLASLKHFMANEYLRSSRQKRGGGKTIVSWDEEGVEKKYLLESGTDLPPDMVYEQRWATTLMEHALDRLRQEFSQSGKKDQFEILKAFLSREAREGEYTTAGAELNMTKGAVGVAVHRLRQRYGELVRSEVANTVAQPTDVDEEMKHLFGVLNR